MEYLIGSIYDGSGMMENLQSFKTLEEAEREIKNSIGNEKITDETDWEFHPEVNINIKNYYISHNCFFIMHFIREVKNENRD